MSSPSVARKPRRKKLGGAAASFISRFRIEEQQPQVYGCVPAGEDEEPTTAALSMRQAQKKKDVNFYHWKYTNDTGHVSTNKRVPKYVHQRDSLMAINDYSGSSTDEDDGDDSFAEPSVTRRRKRNSEDMSSDETQSLPSPKKSKFRQQSHDDETSSNGSTMSDDVSSESTSTTVSPRTRTSVAPLLMPTSPAAPFAFAAPPVYLPPVIAPAGSNTVKSAGFGPGSLQFPPPQFVFPPSPGMLVFPTSDPLGPQFRLSAMPPLPPMLPPAPLVAAPQQKVVLPRLPFEDLIQASASQRPASNLFSHSTRSAFCSSETKTR